MIKGIQKTTLVDYPDKVACTIFLPKCNFRCPYCYNRDLVMNPEKLETIPEDEFLDFLKKRKKWLDGVCITGGEPCLDKELPMLISKIKELGYFVKLDTNGFNPEMLKVLLDKKLVDYIAMDIKGPLGKYDEITRVNVDKKAISKSIELIKNSGIEYEFRSTLMPRLHSKEDIEDIGKMLSGSKRFFLQQFKPIETTIDRDFAEERPFSIEEMKELQEILQKYVKDVEIREA